MSERSRRWWFSQGIGTKPDPYLIDRTLHPIKYDYTPKVIRKINRCLCPDCREVCCFTNSVRGNCVICEGKTECEELTSARIAS
jgi:hypothetical protein